MPAIAKAVPSYSAEKAKLGQARAIVRQRSPYWRSMLLSYMIRETPGLGTVATTKGHFFLVDYEAIKRWSVEQCAFALAHELYHSTLGHHDRGAAIQRHFNLDAKEANWALDMPDNRNVKAMGYTPVDGIIWAEDFGYPDNLTAESYAELLAKDKKAGKKPKAGKGKPGLGSGQCGSCAGHPVDGEPGASDPSARPEGEIERVRKSTAEAIREHARAKGAGSLPGDLLRWADEQLAPAKVRWQDKLARATRLAVAFAAGKSDYKYDAPSKLQGGLGFGPGKPVLARFRAPVPNVAACVDTSASMGQREGVAVLSEIQGILRAGTATLTFMACDTKVHGIKPVSTIKECMAMMVGGGGTDFRPIFEALEKSKSRPGVVIVCTDGDGPAPAVAPTWCKVIWLLVGAGATAPCTWGEAIVVPEDEI